MLFEFVEEVEMRRVNVKLLMEEFGAENELLGISNNVVRMKQSEIVEEFENLNLDDFNDPQPETEQKVKLPT